MPKATCPCCGQTLRTPKAVQVTPSTETMTDAQLYAHYKKTAPVEDVRFMLRHARMSKALERDVMQLLTDAERGLARAAVYARYVRLQERWRVERAGRYLTRQPAVAA